MKSDREERFKLYELIAKNTGDIISVWDLDLNLIYVSPSVEKQMGYTPEEIISLSIEQILDEESVNKVLKLYEREMEKERRGEGDPDRTRLLVLRHMRKDGTPLWMEVSISAIRDEEGEIKYLLVISRNINFRIRALEALKNSEQRFRTIFNSVGDGIFLIDQKNMNIIDVNTRALELYGYEKKSQVAPHNIDVLKEIFHRQGEISANGGVKCEFLSSRKDGDSFWAEIHARHIQVGDRKKLMVVVRDVTKIKEAEETLAQEKEILSVTLQNIGEGIIRTDREGRVVLMNKSAEELVGWKESEAKGVEVAKILLIEDTPADFVASLVRKTFLTGKKQEVPLYRTLFSRKGYSRLISLSVSPILDSENKAVGVIFILRDVSEREKFLRAVQNSQKFEALGTLAAGIAHDFNNVLSGVYGYINLAMMKDSLPTIRSYLEKALSSIERARSLTHQLLTFAKGGMPIKKITPIKNFLQRTVTFALSGSPVSAIFELQENLWSCNFDSNQLAQVIDNIVLNAVQAMPHGGNIIVRAENVSFDTEFITLPRGDYVKISIKDRGIGIPREVLPHIFEPFYTTKETGHGLGLSISYSIVKAHGGEILVESHPGEGTVFYIYLPAVKSEVEEEKEVEDSFHCGNGTIIVLDDDEVLTDVIKEMLSSMGYEVITFRRGEEVIAFLQEGEVNKPLVAIFCDLTIPGGMGGMDILKEVRRLLGGIPVFVMSGYSSDPIISAPAKYGFTASLKKPFKISDIISLLNRYLSS